MLGRGSAPPQTPPLSVNAFSIVTNSAHETPVQAPTRLQERHCLSVVFLFKCIFGGSCSYSDICIAFNLKFLHRHAKQCLLRWFQTILVRQKIEQHTRYLRNRCTPTTASGCGHTTDRRRSRIQQHCSTSFSTKKNCSSALRRVPQRSLRRSQEWSACAISRYDFTHKSRENKHSNLGLLYTARTRQTSVCLLQPVVFVRPNGQSMSVCHKQFNRGGQRKGAKYKQS